MTIVLIRLIKGYICMVTQNRLTHQWSECGRFGSSVSSPLTTNSMYFLPSNRLAATSKTLVQFKIKLLVLSQSRTALSSEYILKADNLHPIIREFATGSG